MIESARDPNSPKVRANSLSHYLKDFYNIFLLIEVFYFFALLPECCNYLSTRCQP